MIEIAGLTKRYGDTAVVDDVSLRIEGGVTALLGPNGAGKSTLLSMVGRLLEPDAGSVTVDGLAVHRRSGDDLARRLAVLRQENHLPVRLTVRELVEFGRFPHSRGRLGPEDHDLVDRAIAALELEEYTARRLDQLSGGQRQRAFIAMVLAQDTDHVLLDEPLNSLDLRHAAATMAMVRRMADDLAKTVVVVLHDVNVAAHHADRLVAMREGRVVADGSPHDVVRPDVLAAVFDTEVAVRDVDGVPVALHFRPAGEAARGWAGFGGGS